MTNLHHKYSASSAFRWTKCPGSIRLIEQAPPQEESKYAKEGTLAHAVLDLLLKGYLKTGELRLAAAALYNQCPAKMISHGVDLINRLIPKIKEYSIVHSDLKVEVSGVGFGTLDIAVVDEFESIMVTDLKYGAGVAVEVEENSQLLYYAVGLAEMYSWSFEKAILVIDQPRAYHSKGPYREWIVGKERVKKAHEELKHAVERCEKPNAPLYAGEHCQWCRAISICPEFKNQKKRMAQEAFKE